MKRSGIDRFFSDLNTFVPASLTQGLTVLIGDVRSSVDVLTSQCMLMAHIGHLKFGMGVVAVGMRRGEITVAVGLLVSTGNNTHRVRGTKYFRGETHAEVAEKMFADREVAPHARKISEAAQAALLYAASDMAGRRQTCTMNGRLLRELVQQGEVNFPGTV